MIQDASVRIQENNLKKCMIKHMYMTESKQEKKMCVKKYYALFAGT